MTAFRRPKRILTVLVAGSVAALAMAGDLVAHQDIELQVAALTRRIAADPNDPNLFEKRADLHRAHGEWALALADYDRALTLDPDRAGSHVGRSSALHATGKEKEALEAAGHAVTLEPENPAGHLARARALAALGDAGAADKAFSRSTALHPRPSPDLFTEHSSALLNQSPPDRSRALEVLEAGIAAIGPIVTLVSPALDLQLATGDPEGALALWDRLPPVLATTPNWLLRRAEILAALRRVPEARQTYQSARETISKLPERRRKTAAMAELLARIERSLTDLDGPAALPPGEAP